MMNLNVSKLQPPSGGCVLKRSQERAAEAGERQPPSGGCVLKQNDIESAKLSVFQPPSGGCVLKPFINFDDFTVYASRLRAAVC